jgi:hypothetical protein
MNMNRMWQSAGAIAALAWLAATQPAIHAATVAHWSFDAATITTGANGIVTAADATGNHNATTQYGGTGGAGGPQVNSVAGQFGEAAEFTNANANGGAQANFAWLSIPQLTEIMGAAAGDFSVSAWVNVADQTSWDDNPILLDWGNVPAAPGVHRFTYWFQLDNVDSNAGLRPRAQLRFDNATDNGGDIVATTLNAAQAGTNGGATNFDDGAWHQLGWTWTKSTGEMRFYTDGVLRHTQVTGQPAGPNRDLLISSSPIGAIGAKRDNNRYFRGLMDEVWVVDRAISDADMAVLRATNVLVPEPAAAVTASLAVLALASLRRRK